jgi:hypothetical protein
MNDGLDLGKYGVDANDTGNQPPPEHVVLMTREVREKANRI